MTTAQNTYVGTKDLKAVKNDTEFVQYLVEMFTTDDEGIEHPEEIQIKAWRGHIAINLHLAQCQQGRKNLTYNYSAQMI